MTRFFLTLIFSTASLTGFGLILYAVLAAPNADSIPTEPEEAVLGFSESTERAGGISDFATGLEDRNHREKEPFDPDKHKPEPL